jgi:anti-sigma factor RsiW
MTAEANDDPRLLVHAYLDGELDPAHALEVERQLASDRGLAAERQRMEALQRAIAERLPRMQLPPGLARRVEAAIAGSSVRAPWRLASPGPSWRALAAFVMLTAVLASGTTWFVAHPQPEPVGLSPVDEMADMVLASHIRALMAPQPADVGSSDRHTVKPWFSGRVTQAPKVVDLSVEGFPLLGGRVDVIGRTPVATLVYRRRQHVISLIAVPADQATSVSAARRTTAGYNLLTWTQDGVVYWAVSDVAAADLDAFAKAFREAPA